MDRGWKGKVAVTLLLLQPASAAVLRTKVWGPSPRPQIEQIDPPLVWNPQSERRFSIDFPQQ